MLATGCDDGQIRLFEPENGTQVKAWGAHGGGVASLEFTRDGRIASVGRDKTPKLWKADGNQDRAFDAFADVGLSVALCNETGRLVSGDWTGEIRVWNAADGARVGALDPNPPRLTDRVTGAEKVFTERKAQLDAAMQAVAAIDAQLTNLPKEREAAGAAKQAAETALAEAEKRVVDTAAAAAAAKQSHAEAAGALPALEQALAAASAEIPKATAAVTAAGDDAAKKEAATQALAATQAKEAEARAKRDAHKAEVDKRAAFLAQTDQQAAQAGTARDQMKAAVAPAAKKVEDVDAALAKARADQPQHAAAVVDLRNQVAAAAESQARWLRETAFQASFDQLTANLRRREESLGQAEGDAAAADAKRQADEQARLAAVAERDAAQKQIDALNAAIAASETKAKELLGQIEKRGAELTATQGTIERTLQALAVLDEAGKSLEKGLTAAAEDADLKQSFAALGAARQAKQAQLKTHQDALASMMAEKGQWEQAVAGERAAVEKRKTEVATVAKAVEAAAAKIESATGVVTASTKIVEEKRAVVAARQSEVDAATKELDALQGLSG
jgi:chromosome segregation ATPase